MINKVTLVGNLGQAPEVKRLENGAAVARLNVATSESYKDKNGEWQNLTEWHQVIMWRALAERAEKQLDKGSMVYIEGKLSTRKWTDKEGKERRTTEVVAAMFRSLDKREKSTQSQGGSFPAAADAPASYSKSSEEMPAKDDSDDLPF